MNTNPCNNTTPSPSNEASPLWGGREGGLPRGLRNNNPLNIRHSKDKWKGRRKTQSDPQFVQFETMAYGYRAAFVLLRTYRVKYGYNTIRKIIKRWAPANENNTEAYIRHVSQWTGIDADKMLAGQDANAWIQIVAAMSRVENGREADMRDVQEGWRMS